jgi:hypothetical protein
MHRNWFGAEMQLYMDVLGGMAIKGEYIFGKNAFPGYQGTTSVVNPLASSILNDTLMLTTLSTKTTSIQPNIQRNFMGYYIYLIKNIGKRNQLALRYDYYDPNTKLKGDKIGQAGYSNNSSKTVIDDTQTISGSPTVIQQKMTTTETKDAYKSGVADIAYGTLTVAWNYYFSDNIRIMLAYEKPWNEKVAVNPATDKGYVTTDYTVNGNKGTLDYSKVFPQSAVTVRLQVKF